MALVDAGNRTYRVIAEGDGNLGRGLRIEEAVAVAEFAREHAKRHVAIVDEQTSTIVDEDEVRKKFIAPPSMPPPANRGE
ncbi:MAG TPA: hypothetical protein VF765_33775 [Polyangiaceae bacterium]